LHSFRSSTSFLVLDRKASAEINVKAAKNVLTNQELEIMKIIWNRGSSTVREVYEDLLTRRKIAYTTVMTMMGTLEQKGHLRKSEQGRAYVYQPVEPQTKVVSSMVQEFVKRVFNGSSRPLLVHLVETLEDDADQIEEIRRLLQAKKLLREKRRKK
jgi:BlaI family transcriptional regulator, penicillinase repressor